MKSVRFIASLLLNLPGNLSQRTQKTKRENRHDKIIQRLQVS